MTDRRQHPEAPQPKPHPQHTNPGTDTTINQSRSHFVEIKNCDDCPFKDYGLRKCEVADRWFSDGEYFEPENSIPSWCPKCTSHAHTPAHPPEAQRRIDAAIVELQEAIETPYFYENEQHIKKAIALLQAGDTK